MERKSARSGAYQLFMLALCLYALVALGIEALIPIDEPTRQILSAADWLVCLLFLADFVGNLVLATNRWKYFATWGWIDLISSIPAIDIARLGRAARILRIFRVLRGIRATKTLASFVLERRAESALLTAALVSILLLVSSSIAILHFERGAESANIRSAEDAIWWAAVTITTVGYGDRFPVSTEGRIIAAMLMTAGVGLFGTFSGFVAAWFLAPTRSRDTTAEH